MERDKSLISGILLIIFINYLKKRLKKKDSTRYFYFLYFGVYSGIINKMTSSPGE